MLKLAKPLACCCPPVVVELKKLPPKGCAPVVPEKRDVCCCCCGCCWPNIEEPKPEEAVAAVVAGVWPKPPNPVEAGVAPVCPVCPKLNVVAPVAKKNMRISFFFFYLKFNNLPGLLNPNVDWVAWVVVAVWPNGDAVVVAGLEKPNPPPAVKLNVDWVACLGAVAPPKPAELEPNILVCWVCCCGLAVAAGLPNMLVDGAGVEPNENGLVKLILILQVELNFNK